MIGLVGRVRWISEVRFGQNGPNQKDFSRVS